VGEAKAGIRLTLNTISRGLDFESQLPAPDKSPIIGYCMRTVELDGKKYAVLEDFDAKKQHLVPFKQEYGQLQMFRAMQYDGRTLQYTPHKSPIEKTMGDRTKELPEKEK
jgi:hypothetical protein